MTRSQKYIRAVLTAASVAGVLAGSTSIAQATCLGLGPPAPADLNICRQLVEDLIIPPVVSTSTSCYVKGWLACGLRPHCCMPVACLTFPDCVLTKRVEEVAGYIVHAGDLYCGLQELSPDQLLSDLVANRFPAPDLVNQAGPLTDVARAYLDRLECGATPISPALFDVLRTVMNTPGFNGAFAELDIRDARLVPHRDSGVLDLPRDGWGGTTIGDLIFLPDALFDALMAWQADPTCLTPSEQLNLSTLVHELVHVRQYRELGRDGFLNAYLIDVLQHGYASAEAEQEAYGVEDWIAAAWTSPSYSRCLSDNTVPIMSGPNTPSGSVEQSGSYGSPYDGWKAFDADPNSQWLSALNVTPAMIGYQWSNGPRVIRRYALTFANGGLTSRAPKDWTLQGNNGAGWFVVDSRQGQSNWGGLERREYSVASPGPYFQYRVIITDDNDARAGIVVVSLGGVELFR
jgi:hypothetical protein